MKGLIDFTGEITGNKDMIYQYGPLLDDNEDAYSLPDDYNHSIYEYIPSTSGIYDPNGFYIKQE
jgi:hypothetical protein